PNWLSRGRFGLRPFFGPFPIIGSDPFPPGAVPGVTVPALGFDFGKIVFFDAVAARKNRTVTFNFVETSPKRLGVRIPDNVLIPGNVRLANAGQTGPTEPRGATFDGSSYFAAGLIQTHQQ